MKILNDIDHKVLSAELAEDLGLLARDVGSPDAGMPTPSIIRGVFAPILRKWVSDNGLKPLHDLAGRQSHYTVYDNKPYADLCNRDHFIHWHGMVPIMGAMVGGSLPRDPAKTSISHLGADREVRYDFKAFRIQKMAYSGGRFLTREQCVRFTADRMGGTHTQAQAKRKSHDPVEFLELTGAAVGQDGNVQLLGKTEFEKAQEYVSDGKFVFSLMHLIVLDTARRFHEGLTSGGTPPPKGSG